MKRRDLQQCAIEIGDEVEKLGYEHWLMAEFPVTFERSVAVQLVQVEIQLLENTSEYLQLCVSVYDGWLSTFAPAGWIVILHKPSA